MLGVSPYLKMMQSNQHSLALPDWLQEFYNSGRSNSTATPGFGGGAPSMPQSQPSPMQGYQPILGDDPTALRRARSQGLVALGASLLDSSKDGDWAGGLARGVLGFQQAKNAELERERARAAAHNDELRRQAADLRAEHGEDRADQDLVLRRQTTEADLATNQVKLKAFQDEQDRGRRVRQATGKSADQMVAEINSLAASNPADDTLQRMAKRAAGYALGEDSDLNKLASLHDDMTQRAGREGDLQFSIDAGLKKAETEAGHGYGPIAEGRRAQEGLAIERRRAELYGTQVNKQMDRDPELKINQWNAAVRQETDNNFNAWLRTRSAGVGQPNPRALRPDYDPKRDGPMLMEAPTPEEIDRARRDAEDKGIAAVNGRLSQYDDYTAQQGGGTNSTPPDPAKSIAIRNLVLGQLLGGDSEQEALAQLRARGTNLFGFTPEQYLENAKRIARQRGWKG